MTRWNLSWWSVTRSLKRLGVLLPVVSVLLGLALLIIDPLPMQTLRNSMFDQYQRWSPREYVDAPVHIVDIDEETLARLGQWPWPRTRLAGLVERLKAAGVAAIGFDILLAEPDRTSPQRMAQLWSLPDALRAALQKFPDHDQVLAGSLADAPAVLGFVLQGGRAQAASARTALQVQAFRYIHAGEPSGRSLHTFDGVLTARPELEAVAAGYGALNFVADSDGIVRRVPLVLSLHGEPVPTLVAELLRVAQGERNYFLKSDGHAIGLAEVRIGNFRVPTTAAGEVWVHYAREQAGRYLPAWQVLQGAVPDTMLEGSIVLIGSSAQGLMDLRFSPLGKIMPGVEAHAQALEQILSGQTLQRPNWAGSVELIAIVIGGLAIAWLSVSSRAVIAAGTTALALLLLLAGGWYAFRTHGLLINTVTPALILIATFVLGSLMHHFISEREHRWIKGVFSRYVSPNRVEFLVTHPDAMTLGGQRQECSFVFTDLADFTALMESIDPQEAVALLNNYLDAMIAIAFRYEGTLDRIVGDAVAIMFSAPVPQADHRARALACALEMDAFAAGYAARVAGQGMAFGKTRIGIHSGEVIVGNFGGSTIFDYRALGDAVNTASRLESVNKQLGTTICLSAETLSGCPQARVRPVGRLVLKGKRAPLQVHEPITQRCVARYAPTEDYLEAYRAMSEEAGGAAGMFSALAQAWPDDPLATLHARRLADGERGDLMVMGAK
ncbi:adenylate/guanylate cyclase domain-containing protein [Uliginosibacterium sp. H3]|uniref:Adenylate/guanylate cyclase domain-containing protein n=1 Tax=Uliginosibacterium silvisoli TaxID=3114758 RepID=A0ABU6K1I4_9RHOO|nr:adenylate/guanylate cyclase domain-containing protein [Uliginosibacterium sp. H3]